MGKPLSCTSCTTRLGTYDGTLWMGLVAVAGGLTGSYLCAVLQAIYKASKTRRFMQDAEKRRLSNKIKHSAPGAVKVKPDRKKKIIAEVE